MEIMDFLNGEGKAISKYEIIAYLVEIIVTYLNGISETNTQQTNWTYTLYSCN